MVVNSAVARVVRLYLFALYALARHLVLACHVLYDEPRQQPAVIISVVAHDIVDALPVASNRRIIPAASWS